MFASQCSRGMQSSVRRPGAGASPGGGGKVPGRLQQRSQQMHRRYSLDFAGDLALGPCRMSAAGRLASLASAGRLDDGSAGQSITLPASRRTRLSSGRRRETRMVMTSRVPRKAQWPLTRCVVSRYDVSALPIGEMQAVAAAQHAHRHAIATTVGMPSSACPHAQYSTVHDYVHHTYAPQRHVTGCLCRRLTALARLAPR